MVEIFDSMVMLSYLIFFQYGIIYIFLMFPIYGIASFVTFMVLKRTNYSFASGAMIGIIIPAIIMGLFLQSDFAKSRKYVDEEWMIGKTIDRVGIRYSHPSDTSQGIYVPTVIDGKEYEFCAREICESDFLDVDGEILYYVLTDSKGKITEVKSIRRGIFRSEKECDTYSRWNGMLIGSLVSILPDFRQNL